MERNLMLLKIAVEQMTAKHKIPISFFECKYRRRRGETIGVKVYLDAYYLESDEANSAMKKWAKRISEFCDIDFRVETVYVDENKDMKVSIMSKKKAPEFVSDADCECGVRE
jgi:hypothetical protein